MVKEIPLNRTFELLVVLAVFMFGFVSLLSVKNVEFWFFPAPFDEIQDSMQFKRVKWDAQEVGFDYPQEWNLEMRDHVAVVYEPSDYDQIKPAIDDGTYQLQYTGNPELAFSRYPELSRDERLEDLSYCESFFKREISVRGTSVMQVTCQDIHTKDDFHYYLFTHNDTLYELGVGGTVVYGFPQIEERIVDSLRFY
jgi:hypothetical protein